LGPIKLIGFKEKLIKGNILEEQSSA